MKDIFVGILNFLLKKISLLSSSSKDFKEKKIGS